MLYQRALSRAILGDSATFKARLEFHRVYTNHKLEGICMSDHNQHRLLCFTLV